MSIDGTEETYMAEQAKFDEFYGGYDEEYAEDIESDDGCDHCGPWCGEWGGDGLCMLVIKEQARQRAEYDRKHTGERNCPICKKRMPRFDCLNVDKLWEWSLEPYDPMIGLEVLGPQWLDKGELHHKGNLYHVWIGEGEHRKEILLKLIPRKSSIVTEHKGPEMPDANISAEMGSGNRSRRNSDGSLDNSCVERDEKT